MQIFRTHTNIGKKKNYVTMRWMTLFIFSCMLYEHIFFIGKYFLIKSVFDKTTCGLMNASFLMFNKILYIYKNIVGFGFIYLHILYNNRIAMSVSTFVCMLAYYLCSFRKIITKNTLLEAPIQGKGYKLRTEMFT